MFDRKLGLGLEEPCLWIISLECGQLDEAGCEGDLASG